MPVAKTAFARIDVVECYFAPPEADCECADSEMGVLVKTNATPLDNEPCVKVVDA